MSNKFPIITHLSLGTQLGVRRQAIGLLFLAAALWSSSGLLIKIISWGPLAILGGRSAFAAVVMLIYLRHLPFRFTRLQILGALAYVATQIFFITATKLTTAANAIFLQYSAPLYLALLGYWFLGERPKRADWAAMAVILMGMLLFFGNDLSFDELRGNIFGILSGLSMAVMILCTRRQKDGAPATTIFLGNIFAVVVGLPFLAQATFSFQNLATILYLGIFQIGLSFVAYSIAIKYVPALEAILILTLEPVLNPVWVFLVLGEIPGVLPIIGGALVMGAVVVRALIGANDDASGSVSGIEPVDYAGVEHP